MNLNLNTSHGRAQAIADGGQAGELARIIEDALAGHSSEREALCWEILNSLTLPDAIALLGPLERLEHLLQTAGDEDTLKPVQDVIRELEMLDADLLEYGRQVRSAIQVLEGE